MQTMQPQKHEALTCGDDEILRSAELPRHQAPRHIFREPEQCQSAGGDMPVRRAVERAFQSVQEIVSGDVAWLVGG
jgi:hypothetical protein